jgi:hypothetical protein
MPPVSASVGSAIVADPKWSSRFATSCVHKVVALPSSLCSGKLIDHRVVYIRYFPFSVIR